jgi:hypothetical protein
MIHNLKLIQRRYPRTAGRLTLALVLLSASALAVGIGLLFR